VRTSRVNWRSLYRRPHFTWALRAAALAFGEAGNGRSPAGAPGAILIIPGLSTLPGACSVGGICFDHGCDQ